MQTFIIGIQINMENIKKVIEEVSKGEFFGNFRQNCTIEYINHNAKKAFFTITVCSLDGNNKKYSMCAELIDMNIDEREDDYEVIQEIIDKNIRSVKEQISLNKSLSLCDYFINQLSRNDDTEWLDVYSFSDKNSDCEYLYYILEIYEYSETLADQMKSRIYNENEIKEIINSVCNALKFCHNKGIYHNNINTDNIYINSNNYKLGRIDLVKGISSNDEISAKTDIAMLCKVINEIANSVQLKKKNADILEILRKITTKSAKYDSIDEVITDLNTNEKNKKHFNFLIIVIILLLIIILVLSVILFRKDNVIYKLGDVNGDGMIDAVDASCILTEYSSLSTTSKSTFDKQQKKAADVNNDGMIDAVDASIVLSFYSYLSTDGKINNMEEWLKTDF